MNNRRITPALALVAALSLPAGPVASATPGEVSGTAATDADARARELTAAIERSLAAENELLARIRNLEEARSELERRIAAAIHASPATAAAPTPSDAALAAAPAAAPTPSDAALAAAPATAPPRPAPPSPIPASTPTASPGSGDAYLPGALAAVALLLAGWVWMRRRRDAAFAPAPAASATWTPDAGSVTSPAPEPGAAPSALDWSAHGETHQPATPSAEPNSEEHKSAVELADIMMSFGRMHGAAETLAEFIRGNPRQAVTPWLKLLEVYRAAGLRIEFDTIAKELNKTFNVNVVTWQNYDELRASTTSIEAMPHIVRNLQRSWRTPACQLYLQQLLRDNREGTRAGFPFTVIDEILLLSAILDDELGPCQAVPDAAPLPPA